MRYTQARELVEAILDQLDEKLFDPVLGHREIENNPKARKFNPKTARPNKVKKREWEIKVGTAGYGGYQSPGASVNDGRYLARERIKEAIDQLDELSKETYRSYIKKAARDISDRAYDATQIAGDEQHEKIRKRGEGIVRADRSLRSTKLDEMAQTNARYRQMGDHIDRASVAYWNKNKPGAGRKWRSLVRQDEKEARSGTLYGHGGKKIKNPKKHRDSRPLGESPLDALNEESEKQMSTRNIKDYQRHIDRLTGTIKYHKSSKPGLSYLHGNQTQSSIDAKVKDLTRIHKELTKRHKKALANHEAGNYGDNKDHYLLNTDWH